MDSFSAGKHTCLQFARICVTNLLVKVLPMDLSSDRITAPDESHLSCSWKFNIKSLLFPPLHLDYPSYKECETFESRPIR